MKPFIRLVTITGIDLYTPRNSLRGLQREFPFVEWGVLLSKSKTPLGGEAGGENRYPSADWIEALENYNLNLSGHLCGAWARDVAAGGNLFVREKPNWPMLFNRMQLNVSHVLNDLDAHNIRAGIASIKGPRIIVQVGRNGMWQHLLDPIINRIDILFDCSGGRGVLPEHWPYPVKTANHQRILLSNCGYAGGLNPDNLKAQLEAIAKVSEGQPVWIDVESGVRTDDVLDLNKVEDFLTIARPYVLNGTIDAHTGSAAPVDTPGG